MRIYASTTAALMLSVFAVSVGFGVVLPILPYLIGRLSGVGVEAAQVSRHTGLLTSVYTLSLFLFAPTWGRLSDRRGSRGPLLVGLVGFAGTMLAFSFVESLTGLYAERFLSGMFAAAVTPIASAAIGNMNTTEQGRARRLSFVSMASIAGFLLGPMLGEFATRIVDEFFTVTLRIGSLVVPLAATALLTVFIATFVAFSVPRGVVHIRSKKTPGTSVSNPAWPVSKMLILTAIVSIGIGVFEVGLVLRGKQELGLTSYEIALMFTECSLVMFVTQAIVFSPWFKPNMTRWLIVPALSVLSVGLFLVPWASGFSSMLGVIGAVAASAGLLSPILTYWISANAGSAQGWELGKQTAASSLGVTMGSAAGGLLYDTGVSFALTAVLVAIGVLLSLGLPHLLLPADAK